MSASEETDPLKVVAEGKKPATATQALAWEMLGLGVVLLVGGALLALLLALTSAKAGSLEEARQEGAQHRKVRLTPVVVTELQAERVVDGIHLPGRIEAWTSVNVPAEVGGQVLRTEDTPVDDGVPVRKGQALLHIDPRDYEIALRQAEAALKLARDNFQRTRKLVAQGVRTPAQLDADTSAMQQAEAAYEQAKLNLERTTIRSPIDGMVDEVLPEVGENVPEGVRVASVLEMDRVKVDIGIPEKDVDMVRARTARDPNVELTVGAVRDKRGEPLVVQGRMTYLSLQPIEEAYVYRMRLEVPNEDLLLRPGMFAEANVVREIYAESLTVPLFAVLTRGDEYFVYVLEEQAAEDGDAAAQTVARQRPVRLGIILGPRVQVLEGLKAGERLVIKGQRQIEDGSAVLVTNVVQNLAELSR